MTRSQLVAEHLPLLRRYARALTGNQASGDAYVGAMLEALLQDPSLLDERHGPRAALFRLFTQIWNSVSINEDADVAVLPLPSERRLSNITPLPRQAFLLLSLEGFSEEEVAFILATDVAETRRLADTAGREMAAEIATDVLIIEDETFIAMDLESLVKNLGHNVIGVARTHSDAVALAKNKKPGLILADIQLADGSSGLDAVNELLRTFEVPVVFITAYPDRRAPRAGVFDLKALPARDGVRRRQPGAVLPAQFPQPRATRGGLLSSKRSPRINCGRRRSGAADLSLHEWVQPPQDQLRAVSLPSHIGSLTNGEICRRHGVRGNRFFAKAGLHPPEMWVYIAAISEAAVGVALVLGICTRFAALGACTVLAIAVYSLEVVKGFGWTWNTGGYEYPVFWALASLAVAIEAWKVHPAAPGSTVNHLVSWARAPYVN
jgi:uncharacterized membrane protein YphA (DoxX/SURF4 family)/DNA-directed RNA polymerase specialized sigma24 family protein